MAVTATPIFTQTPKRGYGQVTTQVTTLDAPGGTTIFTAGANGSRVLEITVQAYQATVALGVVRIFIGTAANAGHLVDEFAVSVVVGSNTAVMYRLSRQYSNMILAASDVMVATTSITQNLGVTAWYADY